MSINNEYRFGAVPKMKWDRTLFKMKSNWKGTFNVGDIIPIYVNQDIYPAETYEFHQSLVCRSQTPLFPTMDDLVLDIYAFFDQKRRLWTSFKKFMGENTNGAWAITADLEEPQIYIPSNATSANTPAKGSLWDYFGLPTGIKSATSDGKELTVSSLPFRAYGDIYNYFFRNQSLIAPLGFSTGDESVAYSPSSVSRGGAIQKASKLPDYWSTSLPEPQKSPSGAIKMPLGTSAPIKFGNSIWGTDASDSDLTGLPAEWSKLEATQASNGGELVGVSQTTVGNVTTTENVLMSDEKQNGLYADLANATASTINALRLFVQTQKVYELDAIFGTRYFDEILYGHFGVNSGAAQFERPQFLGAKRIPIVMNQVAQTSATSETSPLGQTGAFSLTTDNGRLFKQSFTEHGIIIILAVIRQLTHTSQQCIPRQWKRKKRLDYFWHEFEHLGNQPVYNYEIYADGTQTDYEVFGYQERFAELRFDNNRITGEFRSTYSTPLDAWHYGDYYESLPVLSKEWIEETDKNVKRTLAVQNKDQFWMDTTFYINAWKALSPYGNPGLVDHL